MSFPIRDSIITSIKKISLFVSLAEMQRRTEDPSVVNDQRIMIEHLLRTTVEQSRKYESLKAATDGHKCLDISDKGYLPATPGLNAAMIPTEIPDKTKTEKVLQVPEVDTSLAPVDDYCLLIQRLITEVEAEKYGIGHGMSRRIRDDVIHIHKRETRLLRAIYGHDELKNRMPEISWKLAEMSEEEAEAEQSQNFFGAMFGQYGYSVSQHLDANTSRSSQDGGDLKNVEHSERPSGDYHITKLDQARASAFHTPILFFLNSRDDPWNNLLPDAPEAEEHRTAEEKGWLPSWVSGASRLGLHNILPLNPLKSYLRDENIPSLPYSRSGTSMLVTEESHVAEDIASSQDLAALTDSTDTDSTDSGTFMSAHSVIGELDLDLEPLCLVEGEQQESPAILGDQDFSEAAVQDQEKLGKASLSPSLGERLAA